MDRNNSVAHQLKIGSVSLDCQRIRLFVDGVETKLRPQAFEVLRILMEHPDELVTRQHLLDRVWGVKVVTGDSLSQCLVDIRRSLSKFDRDAVLTVPGRGYLFQSHIVNGGSRGRGPVWLFPPKKIFTGIVAVATIVGLMVVFSPYVERHATAIPDRQALTDRGQQPGELTDALVSQARNMLLLSTRESNAEARRLLRQALDIDPNNVNALVTLADATRKSGGRAGSESFRSAWRNSIELTDRALAIDPSHPVAIAQKGWAELYYHRNYEEAARNFERAIRIDPGDPDVVRLASNAMLVLDRPDIGVRLGLQSVAKDPLCIECYIFLSLTAQFAGDLELAETSARRALRTHPGHPAVLERLGDVLLSQDRPGLALEYLDERTDEHAGLLLSKAIAHFRLGNQEQYSQLRAQLLQQHGESNPAAIAQLEAVSGAVDDAFEWLDRYLQLKREVRGINYHSPFYENLRSDARWIEFRRRLGLSHEQLAQIAFDPAVPY